MALKRVLKIRQIQIRVSLSRALKYSSHVGMIFPYKKDMLFYFAVFVFPPNKSRWVL